LPTTRILDRLEIIVGLLFAVLVELENVITAPEPVVAVTLNGDRTEVRKSL
jgi:hypothetical protein